MNANQRAIQLLVNDGLAAGLVVEELLEAVHQLRDDRVGRVGGREPLLHRLDACHSQSWRQTSTSSRSLEPK